MDAGRIVVDAHTHTWGPPEAKEIEAFIATMDKYGIDVSISSAAQPLFQRRWGRPYMPLPLGGNETTFQGIEMCPERFVGLWVPNIFEEPDLVKKRIEEAVRGHGVKGLKIHPWNHSVPANHPILYPVYEAAAKHRLPILVHSGQTPHATPFLAADMARRFPEVPVILGHSGKHVAYLETIPAAKLADNVYLETSGVTISPLWERAVKELGAERVLLGDDGPSYWILAHMAMVDDLEITDEEKEMIIGGSALRLFKLKSPKR